MTDDTLLNKISGAGDDSLLKLEIIFDHLKESSKSEYEIKNKDPLHVSVKIFKEDIDSHLEGLLFVLDLLKKEYKMDDKFLNIEIFDPKILNMTVEIFDRKFRGQSMPFQIV